ncbi:unnamed protein product [Lota lota]
MLSVFFASEVMPTVIRGGCLGLVFAAGCVGIAASSLMELQNNAELLSAPRPLHLLCCALRALHHAAA